MRTIGIDLGTTNSVMAVDLHVVDLRVDGVESPVLPSVVAFPPEGTRRVGAAAKRRRASDPTNTLQSTKRIIGRPWFSRDVRSFQEDYPFELAKRATGPMLKTRAGELSAKDVAARVLQALADGALLDPTDVDAVVGVPSMFDDEQRRQTVQACKEAGFTDVRVIDEPVATAAAYMRTVPQDARLVMTYDFGGGTFDAAVIDTTRDPFRVLAHGGGPHLGGDDIDRALAKHVAKQVLETDGWDLTSESGTFEQLLLACELAKISLSTQEQVAMDIAQIDRAAPRGLQAVTLERSLMDQLCLQFVRQSFVVCDEVLRDAGIRAQQVGAVVAAGGTSAAPIVQRYVGQYFQRKPECDLDPCHVVALGASVCLDVSGTIRPPPYE